MNYSSIVVLNLFLFFQRNESFQKPYQNGEKLFFRKSVARIEKCTTFAPRKTAG